MESINSNNVEFILDQVIENSEINYAKFIYNHSENSYSVSLAGTDSHFKANKEKGFYRVTTIPRVNKETLLPPDQLSKVMEDWLTELKNVYGIHNINLSYTILPKRKSHCRSKNTCLIFPLSPLKRGITGRR